MAQPTLPQTYPPSEIRVFHKALRETNGFHKPLIRPAISGEGYVNWGGGGVAPVD